MIFEEFFKNRLTEDINAARTIGTRAARNAIPAIFDAAYKAIRQTGSCALSFTRDADGATLHISASSDDMVADFPANEDPEWQEWISANSPSYTEIETATDQFIFVIKNVFDGNKYFHDDEAIISAENLRR